MTNRTFDAMRLSIALLAVVVAAGVVALGITDPPALAVGAVFLALVVASQFCGLFRHAAIAALLLGSGAYALLERQRGVEGAVVWAWATVALIASALAAHIVAGFVKKTECDARQSAELIEELTLYDPHSTLLKRYYGELALENEVSRARRGDGVVTLILLVADLPDEHTMTVAPSEDERAQLLGPLLRHTLRSTDHSTRLDPTMFGFILPETPVDGGVAVAHKLRRSAEQHGGQPARCVVVCYPDHATTADDLLLEAEAGLRFGHAADFPVVTGAMLHPIEARP